MLPHERWFALAHRHLLDAAPDLADAIDDYVGESRFGLALLQADLAHLQPSARVLEIGAGSLLLSAALQASGFQVTALEPASTGFSHMRRLRRVVADLARAEGFEPAMLTLRAEDLRVQSAFEFAFSVNTMEHVDDVATVIARVAAALVPGGAHRFVCPNYTFPFEPHFGIPTLGTKDLTLRVFRTRILSPGRVVDPAGSWASLNWITVRGVRRACRAAGASVVFDRAITRRYLERAMHDPAFRRRHGVVMRGLARAVVAAGLPRLLDRVPDSLHPAMSARIVVESRDEGQL